MPRVYFYMRFPAPDRTSLLGGPQVVVQHARILTAHGITAKVVHKGGRSWMRPADPLFISEREFHNEIDAESDLVVFPGRMVAEHGRIPGFRKALLMQNMATNLGDLAPDFEGPYPWHDRAVKGVVCVSEHNAGLIRLGLPGCPVFVVHNRVDMQRFTYRPIEQKEPLILLNSLSREEKNPRHTRMLLHLLRSRNTARKGPNRGHSLQILGGTAPDEMPTLLARSKMLLFLSADEGLPLLPLEAMASGTIVLCYDIGPMDEYVPAECRRPWGDIEGLIALAESVMDPGDSAYWNKVSSEAVSIATRYSAERQTSSVLKAYQSMLEG